MKKTITKETISIFEAVSKDGKKYFQGKGVDGTKYCLFDWELKEGKVKDSQKKYPVFSLLIEKEDVIKGKDDSDNGVPF